MNLVAPELYSGQREGAGHAVSVRVIRGGEAEVCPVTPELDEICIQAAQAVGGGVLAVDLVEHPEHGLVINEINHTMEFHSTVPLTGIDIPGMVVDYLLQVARGEVILLPQSGGIETRKKSMPSNDLLDLVPTVEVEP